MEFVSPTRGVLTFGATFQEIVDYIEQDPTRLYRLIVGTDSMLSDQTTFVTAIVIHRVGRGGRYFYRKVFNRKIESLRQRMFYETALSLEAATKLTAELSKNGHASLPVSIHLDVGQNGETRSIIREVVGMVTGNGFVAVIKPDAYGATKVADRHSK